MITSSNIIHVAVAVIKNASQQVLLTLRPEHVHQGGLWEFPGGKLEAGEQVSEALARELDEELGIAVTRARPLIRIQHDYRDRYVLLDVWLIDGFDGEPHAKEGQAMAWVDISELAGMSMPAANLPIVRAIQLPDTYLITPDQEMANSVFLDRLEACLQSGIRLVQFRDKRLREHEYLERALGVIELAHRYGASVMLNHTPELFNQTRADGQHMSSAQLMALSARPIPEDVTLSASCHDLIEVQQANKVGVDFIVLSPVLPTLSHPGAASLGWTEFQRLTEEAAMPVYALGGLGMADRSTAFQHGGQGIAAIRSLWDVAS